MKKIQAHACWTLELLADAGSLSEWEDEIVLLHLPEDKEYDRKLREAKESSGLKEAVRTGCCLLKGNAAAFAVMDSAFLMGTMGYAVGEKITSFFERARKERLPAVVLCTSAGARVQEGILSLMQMAKTAAALKRHGESGLLSVSVLLDPTLGGVTASFGMLADIVLASAGAVVGFAGARVIERTHGKKLPPGFQSARYQLENGFIDRIVEAEELREELAALLSFHTDPVRDAKESEAWGCGTSAHEGAPAGNKRQLYGSIRAAVGLDAMPGRRLRPWDQLAMARSGNRPEGLDYINSIFDGFMQLHGDRLTGDDHTLIGGLAWLEGIPVTVIVQQRGRGSCTDAVYRNFGMPMPEGYRKAVRLMEQAEKFCRPVICLIDTPGASCSAEAEERGQASAIARCLSVMGALKTPVLSIVTGEGESGGALALAFADEVWILENAVYSVISPESYAEIIWRDGSKKEDAAGRLGMTSDELYKLGVVDKIIPERTPVTKENMGGICKILKEEILDFVLKYRNFTPDILKEQRYARFRKF